MWSRSEFISAVEFLCFAHLHIHIITHHRVHAQIPKFTTFAFQVIKFHWYRTIHFLHNKNRNRLKLYVQKYNKGENSLGRCEKTEVEEAADDHVLASCVSSDNKLDLQLNIMSLWVYFCLDFITQYGLFLVLQEVHFLHGEETAPGCTMGDGETAEAVWCSRKRSDGKRVPWPSWACYFVADNKEVNSFIVRVLHKAAFISANKTEVIFHHCLWATDADESTCSPSFCSFFEQKRSVVRVRFATLQ